MPGVNVNAFSYNQCAPLTWGHSPPATSAAQVGITKWGDVSTAYGTNMVKTPWDPLRRVGEFPRSRVSRAHLRAVACLKDNNT